MSTRANIIVIGQDGQRRQYYHHTDGYPEWMGNMLANFFFTSYLCTDNDKARENFFLDLLDKEGRFESEAVGNLHGDIEYLWLVKLGKEDHDNVISYEPLKFGWDSDDAEVDGLDWLAKNGTVASEIFKRF